MFPLNMLDIPERVDRVWEEKGRCLWNRRAKLLKLRSKDERKKIKRAVSQKLKLVK